MHAGEYLCIARNAAGSSSYSTVLNVNGTNWFRRLTVMLYLCFKFCFLSFPVPPQIPPFEFSDNPINSGDTASITCTVSKGDFPINITWTLNGRLASKIDGISIFRSNKKISQLNIESVQAEHAGDYTCIARNAAGSTSYSTSLQVNGISLVLLDIYTRNSFLVSPLFVFSPTTRYPLRIH